MNYEGLTACALLIAMVCFHLGRKVERHMAKRDTDATERTRQKYQATIASRRGAPNNSTKN